MKWGALLLVSSVALAAPHIKTPTVHEVLASDLVARARVRWSVVDEKGKRTVVEVGGGEAFRTNPGWSSEPARLPYDLAKNRRVERAIKDAKLPAPSKKTPRAGDRVLELVAEADEGWVVIAAWTSPLAVWRKRAPAIVDELEPLLKVQADVFGTMKSE